MESGIKVIIILERPEQISMVYTTIYIQYNTIHLYGIYYYIYTIQYNTSLWYILLYIYTIQNNTIHLYGIYYYIYNTIQYNTFLWYILDIYIQYNTIYLFPPNKKIVCHFTNTNKVQLTNTTYYIVIEEKCTNTQNIHYI